MIETQIAEDIMRAAREVGAAAYPGSQWKHMRDLYASGAYDTHPVVEAAKAAILAETNRCFFIAKRSASKAAEDKIRLAVGGRNILSQLAEERQKVAEGIATQIAEGEQP